MQSGGIRIEASAGPGFAMEQSSVFDEEQVAVLVEKG